MDTDTATVDRQHDEVDAFGNDVAPGRDLEWSANAEIGLDRHRRDSGIDGKSENQTRKIGYRPLCRAGWQCLIGSALAGVLLVEKSELVPKRYNIRFFNRFKKPTTGNSFPRPTVQQLYPADKAIQKVATLARAGDADAQYQMGVHHSESSSRNVVLSLGYLKEAAKNGHALSRVQVVMTLMKGFDDVLATGGFSYFARCFL